MFSVKQATLIFSEPTASREENQIRLFPVSVAPSLFEDLPGYLVLDFGTGSGYASRILAQTSRKVTSCAVSALSITKRLRGEPDISWALADVIGSSILVGLKILRSLNPLRY